MVSRVRCTVKNSWRKQLGQRNLTEQQKSYLRGKRYLEEKKEQGGNRGNQYTKEATSHCERLPKATENTAVRLAKEYGVGHSTIHRDKEFALAVDKIAEAGGDAPRRAVGVLGRPRHA